MKRPNRKNNRLIKEIMSVPNGQETYVSTQKKFMHIAIVSAFA